MSGRLFVAWGPEAERGVHELAGIRGASGGLLSPDGVSGLYTADGDLYVVPVHGGSPTRLTDDAEPGVFSGLAEFVATEELHRFEGAWWSADSRFLAFAHVDERGVPPFTIAHTGGSEPDEEVHHYPFAGGPNAQVSLRVASVDDSELRRVDLGMEADDYLARVIAHSAGGWAGGGGAARSAHAALASRRRRWIRNAPLDRGRRPMDQPGQRHAGPVGRPHPAHDRSERVPPPGDPLSRRRFGARADRRRLGRHRGCRDQRRPGRGALHRDPPRRPRAPSLCRAARRAATDHRSGAPDGGARLAHGGGQSRRGALDRHLVRPRARAAGDGRLPWRHVHPDPRCIDNGRPAGAGASAHARAALRRWADSAARGRLPGFH